MLQGKLKRKEVKKMNLKTMILGTMIMLLGGFIMADPSSSLGGLESLIVLIGLIIGVFGFFKKD
jgi:hypothetical protein